MEGEGIKEAKNHLSIIKEEARDRHRKVQVSPEILPLVVVVVEEEASSLGGVGTNLEISLEISRNNSNNSNNAVHGLRDFFLAQPHLEVSSRFE